MKKKRRNLVREEFQSLNEGEREKRFARLGYDYGYRGKILMFFFFWYRIVLKY